MLVRADAISDPIASRRPMQTETGTRQLSSRRRSITSGTIELLNNIQEVTGLVTIMDVKSRTPGYEDY